MNFPTISFSIIRYSTFDNRSASFAFSQAMILSIYEMPQTASLKGKKAHEVNNLRKITQNINVPFVFYSEVVDTTVLRVSTQSQDKSQKKCTNNILSSIRKKNFPYKEGKGIRM